MDRTSYCPDCLDSNWLRYLPRLTLGTMLCFGDGGDKEEEDG